MKPIYRPANYNDLATLLEFEQGVVNAERPFDSTIKTDNTYYYDLEKMIDDPNTYLLVAQSGNELIGSGYVRIENSKQFLKHRQHAYMGFMYVKPAYRGRGIIKDIIEALKKWAMDKKIFEIRLEVYCQNFSAIKAYEKAGFINHMIEMRMNLKGDDS